MGLYVNEISYEKNKATTMADIPVGRVARIMDDTAGYRYMDVIYRVSDDLVVGLTTTTMWDICHSKNKSCAAWYVEILPVGAKLVLTVTN